METLWRKAKGPKKIFMVASCTLMISIEIGLSTNFDAFLFYVGDTLMDDYATIKEFAQKWNVSIRWVQQMCASGRILGVKRFGNVWAIPKNTTKPKDARITSGKYKNWRKETD